MIPNGNGFLPAMVLIVAKCIVNNGIGIGNLFKGEVLIVAKCIVNYRPVQFLHLLYTVLIVAKCIVNKKVLFYNYFFFKVLIVAKCIVNVQFVHLLFTENFGINSSKVYCKLLRYSIMFFS